VIEPGDIETRQPYPGESLYGLIAAVTAENDLVRVALIAGDGERAHGQRPMLTGAGADELLPLAEMLEIDISELVLRSYRTVADNPGRRTFFGTTVARVDVRRDARFFSPGALARQPFHRAMWQLRIPFDIETGEILLSKCPLCSRTQRWRHSAGIAFCDGCGDSLDQQTDRIEDDVLPEAALAVGLTHTDPDVRARSLAMLPEEIASLGPAAAYELLLRLVPVVEPGCTWTRGDRLWRNDPHGIARGMQGAWRLLASWPEAMTDRISRDIATSSTRHTDGNRGETVRFLKLRDSDHLPQNLRSVIRRLRDSIDLAGPHGAAVRGRTMICKEVSSLLGIGTAQLVAMRRRGVFRTIGVAKGPILVPAFDREEVLQVTSDYRRRQPLLRANGVLGLPYYAVEQLCALGHLPLLSHPYFDARYGKPQTTEDAIKALVGRLTGGHSPGEPDAIPILSAMQMVGGRLKPWDSVIEAMLSGVLRYSLVDHPGPLFDRIRVRREDLRPHLDALISRAGANTASTQSIDPDFPFLVSGASAPPCAGEAQR
jgi:hypothetical protein